MSKTIEVKAFNYEELNASAQERARDFYREHKTEHYAWGDDALESLQALAKHFGGKLTKYEIDFTGSYSPSFADFEMPELERDEIKRLLDTLGSFNPETLKGLGDCKLTGFCMDESAIDGLRIAFMREGETDIDNLMQAAFKTWLADCQSDCAEENSDEQIAERIIENGLLYTETGDRAVKLGRA